ncbi:MAG: primosomal protein N' [Planctomycetes bacterium]|nr:primosomal protein N' [Planctomycetota bacterium]
MSFAQIVFPVPIDRAFTYRIPAELSGTLKLGARVRVPFGTVSKIGYCVGFLESATFPKIKDIEAVIDTEPLITEHMLKLCQWMADYYFSSLGQALECVLPASVREIPTAKKSTKVKADPFYEQVARTEPLTLTQHQKEAYDAIAKSIEHRANSEEAPNVFLLHGVTGSGKTEIYLQVMAKVRESGKQTIVLVPEIALTPQTVHRFRERFGDSVAVLHSHLTAKQRLIQWQNIRNGQASVVIGARSAIFAPFKNLGLIVIDEEHETSFKNISTPFYHAREAAIERARLEHAIVILGSATPSLESYYNSIHGTYHRLVLPERIDHRPMPNVEVVDMLQQNDPRHSNPVLSKKLEIGIRDEVLKGNQVILFLNRRGFITLIKCSKCGHIMKCRRCQVSLAYHKQFNKAVCHYCNEKTELPTACPECAYPGIRQFGIGTEKVEDYLHKFWDNLIVDASAEKSQLTIGRMDSDAMKKKGLYKDALHSFFTGETDVLVGTQMIAKGLDFPNVTLVGIVSADTTLYLKDFRSAERTFQLITQVAGRTGRGPKGGRVIVQTVNPEHYSIMAGSNHDYEGFARQELLYRSELNYPPFRRIIRILVSGKNQDVIKETIDKIARQITKELAPSPFPLPSGERIGEGKLIEAGDIEILGPAPAPILRIRDRFRWHLVLKIKELASVQKYFKGLFKMPFAKGGVQVSIDTDPVSLL